MERIGGMVNEEGWELNYYGWGSLIRGSNGKWICGFARKLGYYTTMKAELWAMFLV